MHGGERHQLRTFFQPEIVPAVILLFEVFMVKGVEFLPKVVIEPLQREVAHIFQVVEEPFFHNAYSVLDTAFVFGLLHLRGKDRCMIMIRPLGIILIQVRIDPVLIGKNGLLAV